MKTRVVSGFWRSVLWPAVLLVLTATILLGLAYPLCITGVARLAFPGKSAGSLMVSDGVAVGSELIGQDFAAAGYFWGRPSATSAKPYDASASGASNLGPLNPALVQSVKERAAALAAAGSQAAIPSDLLTASASGLDPNISVEAAEYQVARVAAARSLAIEQVRDLVHKDTEAPLLGFLGEYRVNVLRLNLDLDRLTSLATVVE